MSHSRRFAKLHHNQLSLPCPQPVADFEGTQIQSLCGQVLGKAARHGGDSVLVIGPLNALYRQEADLTLGEPGVGVPHQAVPSAQFALADVHFGVSAVLASADSNYMRHPRHLLRNKGGPLQRQASPRLNQTQPLTAPRPCFTRGSF
jgi:hypothetical protein